jgi:hypothetical protein
MLERTHCGRGWYAVVRLTREPTRDLTEDPPSSRPVGNSFSSNLISQIVNLIVFLSTPHTGYRVKKITTEREGEHNQLKS